MRECLGDGFREGITGNRIALEYQLLWRLTATADGNSDVAPDRTSGLTHYNHLLLTHMSL
jgi:hypothetical protein